MIYGRCQFIGILAEAPALRPYECLYELVAQVSAADGDCTGLTEQGGIAISLQTEEALHRMEVDLFGLPSGEDGFDDRPEVRTDPPGPGDEVFRTIGSVFPGIGRKMFLNVGVVVAYVRPDVGGYAFSRMIDTHLGGGEGHIHLLSYEGW